VILAAEPHVSGRSLGWYFAAAVVLILLNGLFVAFEFAILAARRSTFESPRTASKRSSRAALDSMSDLSMQLAGAQLGITMASLGLGSVAEPALESLFARALGGVLSESMLHAVGFAGSLAIVVFLHLVLGEMVPKNLALAAPDETTRLLILPYRAYLAVVRPLVRLLNALAGAGCRLVGVEPRDELVAVHSASELAAIVSHSSEEGAIDAGDAQLLSGALSFALRPVGEVAVPLHSMATLKLGSTAFQAERVVAASGQERIPIVGNDHPVRVIGYVHARDLLSIPSDRRLAPLPAALIRSMAIVRKERSLIEVLRALRRVQRQMAVVVADGEPIAIVSVEDVVRALMSPPMADPAPSENGAPGHGVATGHGGP
jgi:CBS domain containing-hemolysin-like protein